MPTVTYNNESFTCTTALKGTDYIHLLDASGDMIVAFDSVADFSGFSITDGVWTSPKSVNDCNITVLGEDGVIRPSTIKVSDIPSSPADIGAAAADHTHTPASIGAAALDNGKVTASQASASIVSITASTTLALTHAGKFLLADSTSAITITIPTYETVTFPDQTEIEIVQWNTGAVSIATESGVSLVSLDSSTSIGGQYGCVCLKKIATDTWLLAGALA